MPVNFHLTEDAAAAVPGIILSEIIGYHILYFFFIFMQIFSPQVP